MIGFEFGLKHARRFAKRAEVLLPSHPSLFSGIGGLSLLYSNLFFATRDEVYGKKAIQFLEKSIWLLSEGQASLNLANGAAGIGWLIKYFIKKQILTPADAESLGDFDELLIQSLQADGLGENRYYDLLFGIIGKGVYFFEGTYPVGKEALELIFTRLKNLAVETEEGKLWHDLLGKEQRNEQDDYYNYGLAHGLPSIIVFLSRLFDKGIEQKQCVAFTHTIINHLQTRRLKNGISEFPSFSTTTEASRLAWCYGDLGIAFAFLHAAKTLNEPSLVAAATNLALSAAKRRLDKSFIRNEGNILENGFCHGTLGLAHIFNQLHKKIGDDRLVEAKDYWLSLTFGQNKKSIVSNEYDTEKGVWMEGGTLLNGYCGMGLVLLNLMDEQCDGLVNITLTEL